MVFERFDQDARRAIIGSQAAARALGRASIGTEHLLLALLRSLRSEGASILSARGISYRDVLDAIGEFDPFP